jgi:hypothetical protein
MLGQLAIGESATIPRRSADDVYRMGQALQKTFTTRAIDSKKSRVWRLT